MRRTIASVAVIGALTSAAGPVRAGPNPSPVVPPL